MTTDTNDRDAKLKALRAPFPAHQVSTLPKPYRKDSEKGRCPDCGGWHGLPAAHLSYIGHAALTARLLDVDPEWTWEPLAVDAYGNPALDSTGGLWIKLTVCGVTRLGYGDATNQRDGSGMKERIGDALRNAGMRFGIALDLWHKGDLYLDDDAGQAPTDGAQRMEPWTEKDITDALAAMTAAQSYDELKAIFGAVWPRATEAQRAKLQPAYDAHKAHLTHPQLDASRAAAPAANEPGRLAVPGAPTQPLGTHPPRSRTRSPRSTH